MYHLFLVLYNVALRYLEFQTSCQPGPASEGAEMDHYLAALGFSAPIPSAVHQQVSQPLDPDSGYDLIGHEYEQREEPMMWMGNGAELEDWFSSNRMIMGLLHESDCNILGEDWMS